MEYTKEYVGLRLERPLVKILDELAEKMGITRSDLIRQTLRERFSPIDYATNHVAQIEVEHGVHNLP